MDADQRRFELILVRVHRRLFTLSVNATWYQLAGDEALGQLKLLKIPLGSLHRRSHQ